MKVVSAETCKTLAHNRINLPVAPTTAQSPASIAAFKSSLVTSAFAADDCVEEVRLGGLPEYIVTGFRATSAESIEEFSDEEPACMNTGLIEMEVRNNIRQHQLKKT